MNIKAEVLAFMEQGGKKGNGYTWVFTNGVALKDVKERMKKGDEIRVQPVDRESPDWLNWHFADAYRQAVETLGSRSPDL